MINKILDNFKINELLEEIYVNDYEPKEDSVLYANSFHKMWYEYKLIEEKQHHTAYSLTDFGKRVLDAGGWLAYLEKEHQKEAKRIEKEDLDFKISYWQVKTAWWPLILSIIAILISVVAIIWK